MADIPVECSKPLA
ncbi:hypothetical protein CRE_16565 [Caenorhabditis remanei]|uniref:Uncharacterized protein n=1 Tax=Caenorhabditis remanei TaxID=31234 RepID=E3NU46_CAERE|nr:hypothetical protein CRE_16565 [Caenorhabditis remanei]